MSAVIVINTRVIRSVVLKSPVASTFRHATKGKPEYACNHSKAENASKNGLDPGRQVVFADFEMTAPKL